jgi:hypothetical protein
MAFPSVSTSTLDTGREADEQRLLRTSVASTAVLGATFYATSTPLYAEEARPARSQRAETRPGRSSNGDKVGS